MALLVCLLIFLALFTGHSNASYCICKDGLSDQALQKTIDYACGAGADCSQIVQNAACYNPNTYKDHCSYAANSYYQRKVSSGATCDFQGTAQLSPNPPSNVPAACYQTTSGSTTPTTPIPTPPSSTTPTTPTNPSTGLTPPTGINNNPPTGFSPPTGISNNPPTGFTPPTGINNNPPTGFSPPGTVTPTGGNPFITPPGVMSPSSFGGDPNSNGATSSFRGMNLLVASLAIIFSGPFLLWAWM